MRKHLARIDGPSPTDLAAIDFEWPLIAAELDVLDAEIALLYAEDRGGPTPMDWRRLRRAEARVTKTAAELAADTAAKATQPKLRPGGRRQAA
ncbi:DUF6284 family protein [Spirilliplanes yamanashiensis]|uniref:DUF6284 family protein n=1 Tax=Spirilliplanes yamanashiensis TaxID=42233 RepID=UPI0027868166|nr:DUF6284 family protein [Spirilliplanes yamanashiensis]MDP9815154.1 hypothetical protein [Spirilliplanes yamanashiensis]MDP9815168.1 hypothetical protein [Spirilliplanes yamanashiensis]